MKKRVEISFELTDVDARASEEELLGLRDHYRHHVPGYTPNRIEASLLYLSPMIAHGITEYEGMEFVVTDQYEVVRFVWEGEE